MLCSLHFVSQRWRHFTVSPAERRKPNKSSVGTKAQSAKSMGDPAQTEVWLSHVAHSPNHCSSPSKRIQASGHKAESTGKQIKENISLIVLLPKHNQDSLFWSCGDFLYSGHACNCISCLSYWAHFVLSLLTSPYCVYSEWIDQGLLSFCVKAGHLGCFQYPTLIIFCYYKLFDNAYMHAAFPGI